MVFVLVGKYRLGELPKKRIRKETFGRESRQRIYRRHNRDDMHVMCCDLVRVGHRVECVIVVVVVVVVVVLPMCAWWKPRPCSKTVAAKPKDVAVLSRTAAAVNSTTALRDQL